MAQRSDCEDLMELLKEYETLIVLEQHDRVSKLGSKICANLVELLDEDLSDEIDNDDKVAKSIAKSSTLNFIENFCNSIFYQGKIAAAYAEVREFVRIRVSIIELLRYHTLTLLRKIYVSLLYHSNT